MDTNSDTYVRFDGQTLRVSLVNGDSSPTLFSRSTVEKFINIFYSIKTASILVHGCESNATVHDMRQLYIALSREVPL